MYDIPVFKAERDAGLEQAIRTQKSVAYACAIEIPTAEEVAVLEQRAHANLKVVLSKAAEDLKHLNLFYLKAVLATAGVWNKNDDVFDPIEVWAARATPMDQPINDGHDCTKIIGHITETYPVSEKMDRLADDLAADELPNLYHLVTAGVIYKHYDQPDRQKEVDVVIKAIADGKRSVSMECLFRGFDYAVVDPAGKEHVVARSNDSAFLTKHLRAYGGKGVYEGHKVGRMMRNITFSGKGIVAKPANPPSVILSSSAAFNPQPKKTTFVFSQTVYRDVSASDPGHSNSNTQQESTVAMAQTNETELLQKQVADLTTKLEAAQATIKASESKGFETKIADLEKQLTAKATEVETLTKQVKDNDAAKTSIQAKLDETVKSLEATKSEVTTLKAEQTKSTRLNTLKAKLKVDEAKAADIFTNLDLAEASDEKFAAKVEFLAKKYAVKAKADATDAADGTAGAGKVPTDGKAPENKKTAVKTVTVGDSGKGKKAPGVDIKVAGTKADNGADEDVNGGAGNASEKVLETVEEEPGADLATAGSATDEKVETTRAAIATYLGSFMGKNRRNKAE